jgi:acetyl-CoA carboxylase / biotin carboxylase 1
MNNIQYKMEVFANSNENFTIFANGGSLPASVKKLADDGILILFGGKSHVVYLKEDTAATTLMVDGATFLMENENDPTQLKSPSPGKLVRYMVQDGDHLSRGDAYAEIEVMKMYMPLISQEAGIFTSLKPISSVLSTGYLIGSLVLDDPSSVKKPTEFERSVPVFEY